MGNIAMYLRISKSDEAEDESGSITNQRSLIKHYILNDSYLNKLNVVEYIDDGYTGSNEDRPAFCKLIEDVTLGNLECIIVKDISRFSRNYLMAGEYLEKLFPLHNTRFIAINDSYDNLNNTTTDIVVALKSIVHTLYSKETSMKIAQSHYAKAKRGEVPVRTAPYGYMKDPDDRSSLLIDPESSEIVRKIYKLRLEGYTLKAIAEVLNSKMIATPIVYNHRKYGIPKVLDKEYKWRIDMVGDILRNDLYIGVITYYKKNNKTIHINTIHNYEKIIHKESHEPIIALEDFEKVQAMRVKRIDNNPNKRIRSKGASIWKRQVVCANCGYGMKYFESKRGESEFRCRESDYICNANTVIKENTINKFCVEEFNNRGENSTSLETITSSITTRNISKQRPIADSFALYEQYQMGIINKEKYMKMKMVNDSTNLALDTKRLSKKEVSLETIVESVDKIYVSGRNDIKIIWK